MIEVIFFIFFSFCAQHTPPPLVDYSKGQCKSGQAAIRKPIYLIWFMGYCTDWSLACQVVLVFIQVEKADHRENHTNLALIKPLVNEVILTNHTASWFYLCLLLNHHISCDVWLSYYVFSSFFSPPPHSGQRSGFVAELQPYSLPEINLLLKDTFHTYGFWLFFHFKSSIP